MEGIEEISVGDGTSVHYVHTESGNGFEKLEDAQNFRDTEWPSIQEGQ